MKERALSGLKVLDFGQIVAGGHLSAVLADFGAEVIKVESLQGESLRQSGPVINGQSGYFAQENRGKKSLSIDLKNNQAQQLIKEMLPQFDILIENFRPGTMAKFGLDYDTCAQINPRIIYLSISGFGQNNSRTQEPAYDIVLQAASGLACQTGTKDSGPMRVPASIVDYTASLNGAISILAALRYRDQTGQGQYIDVAMYDGLLSIMDNSFVSWQHLKETTSPEDTLPVMENAGLIACGSGHPGTCPHGFYPTTDGYIAHMSLSEKMWQSLCKIINRPDLAANEQFSSPINRRKQHALIDEAISSWTKQHSTQEVIAQFTAERLPVNQVRNIAEAYEDPHNQERGIFSPIDINRQAVMVPNFPAKLSVTPAEIQGPAPDLGQHSSEILKKYLHLSDEQIQDLINKQIVK